MTAQFLLIMSVLQFIVDLILQLRLHFLRHICMFFQLAESIHVVLLLVQFEWVEAVLLVVLIINILRSLLPRNLLLSSLQLLVDGLEHAALFVGFAFFLFFWVLIEQFIRNIKQFPQVRILGLQLLNVEFVGLYDAFVDVPVVFDHCDFHFINLIPVELYLTL